MRCEQDLRGLLRKYVDTGDTKMDRAAIDAAAAIFRAFYTTYRIWLVDEVDEDLAQDVTRMFVDFSFALSRNPFWAANAGHLNPIAANAVLTWTTSAKYLDLALNSPQGTAEDEVAHYRVQAMATQNAFIDLMCAVLSLACPDYLDRAQEIRDALVKFKEQHLFA